jgi:hypothetical protein
MRGKLRIIVSKPGRDSRPEKTKGNGREDSGGMAEECVCVWQGLGFEWF